MKDFTFIVIDENPNEVLKTKAVAESFQNLLYLGSATSYDEGIDAVLEHQPDLVFLEIAPQEQSSDLSLSFINALYRYMSVVPKIIITTANSNLAYEAIKYGVYDYLLKPLDQKELRKTIARLNKEANVSMPLTASPLAPQTEQTPKNESPEASTAAVLLIDDEESEVVEHPRAESNSELLNDVHKERPITAVIQKEKPLVLCVKSYGDYRYIDAADICYLQADNNSTDLHLSNGEMITAFKTLKHFESVLKNPFFRIHNSYIVNIDFISRIHTGNAVCHIKNSTTKLPFSKSYKETIDEIIAVIASGNYLEV